MKKCLFLYLNLIIFSYSVHAQKYRNPEIPSIIINNFQKSFPQAKDVEWKKRNEMYCVEFEIGFWNDEQTIWYDQNGKMMRHEKEISKKELPEIIRIYISNNYPWYWIREVKKISENGKNNYEVEIRSISEEWELVFDESGKLISKKRD